MNASYQVWKRSVKNYGRDSANRVWPPASPCDDNKTSISPPLLDGLMAFQSRTVACNIFSHTPTQIETYTCNNNWLACLICVARYSSSTALLLDEFHENKEHIQRNFINSTDTAGPVVIDWAAYRRMNWGSLTERGLLISFISKIISIMPSLVSTKSYDKEHANVTLIKEY